MRGFRVIALLSLCAFAQSPEAGHVKRVDGSAILTIDSGRPLDSAAITLAQEFGIAVSVEDPPYFFQDDVKDVTREVSRAANPSHRVLVPKGGTLEVEFALAANGTPQNVQGLLQNLVDQANQKFPFLYRVDNLSGSFTLVPTHTRDANGRSIEITPLMDRRIDIPLATRTIAETAAVMSAELSAQTGLHVSCCQSFVAGIPWGMKSVLFEARNEPARDVLRRLIAADDAVRSSGYHWLQRCDPAPSGWCFINLAYVQSRTQAITPQPSQTALPGSLLGNSKWFDATPNVRPPVH
jgi:hypothetical protein